MNLPSAVRGLRDRLSVRDLRLTDVALDFELAPHAIDDDLEMQLAHSADQRLAGFLVRGHAERRIFHRQALKRVAELFLIGLGLGLDRDRDHRLGKFHFLEKNRLPFVAKRVAGRGEAQTDGRGDVAGFDLLDVLALVGVHLEQAPEALALALGGIVNHVARRDLARVDAEISELTDVRIVLNLERERRKRLAGIRACAMKTLSRRRIAGSLPSTGGISSGDGR